MRPLSATMAAIAALRNRLGLGETRRADDEPVEGARARFDLRRHAVERRPKIGQARLDVGRRGEDRRDRPRARAARRAVERRAGAVEPGLVGEDEPAVAPQAPGIAQRARRCALSPIARRPNTSVSTASSSASAAMSMVSVRSSRAPLEQERLLRQPAEARAGSERERRRDPGRRSVAAVDLFRRRRRRLDRRARLERERHAVGVAARDAAAGVDEHRLARVRRAGKAPAQAPRLEQPLRLRAARPPRERRPRLGLGALAAAAHAPRRSRPAVALESTSALGQGGSSTGA